jgi:hypothetical protein
MYTCRHLGSSLPAASDSESASLRALRNEGNTEAYYHEATVSSRGAHKAQLPLLERFSFFASDGADTNTYSQRSSHGSTFGGSQGAATSQILQTDGAPGDVETLRPPSAILRSTIVPYVPSQTNLRGPEGSSVSRDGRITSVCVHACMYDIHTPLVSEATRTAKS